MCYFTLFNFPSFYVLFLIWLLLSTWMHCRLFKIKLHWCGNNNSKNRSIHRYTQKLLTIIVYYYYSYSILQSHTINKKTKTKTQTKLVALMHIFHSFSYLSFSHFSLSCIQFCVFFCRYLEIKIMKTKNTNRNKTLFHWMVEWVISIFALVLMFSSHIIVINYYHLAARKWKKWIWIKRKLVQSIKYKEKKLKKNIYNAYTMATNTNVFVRIALY